MKKTGIFYGSTTGTTEQVAHQIAQTLGVPETDIFDVAKASPSQVGNYDIIILGASTWGDGELQDDMADFINGVRVLDLKGRKVAIFGCGDETMSETFCNAVGILYDDLKNSGATIIGPFDDKGYSYTKSEAVIDGVAEGLLIDNVNHEELTAGRIKAWTDELKKEF